MENILKYLKEKQEEFYPDEPEDSIEEQPIEDYGLEFMDNDFPSEEINVEKIPNNSDPTLNSDEFLYSNSDSMSFYARGNGFNITDNLDLYEIIKLVKDLTDKHLYFRDMSWNVDVVRRKAIFNFILGKEVTDESDEFFLKGVQQYVTTQMIKKFGNLYMIDAKFLNNNEGQKTMKLTIERDKNEEEQEIKQLYWKNPNGASLISQSSISKI